MAYMKTRGILRVPAPQDWQWHFMEVRGERLNIKVPPDQ